MRITIDTEKELIIVPDTFFEQINKKNKVLEKAGAADKKIDPNQYIIDSFNAAMKNKIIRKSDLKWQQNG